jgi:hypothetical protein
MGGEWDHIARCLDLRDEDISACVVSRQATKSLLDRLAGVSAPNTGVAKVLLVFARMATTACDWLEGDLSIELTGAGEVTLIRVATDLGGGLLERALPTMSFRAPLGEFSRAVDRVPHMIVPLAVRSKTQERVVLSATEAVRVSSAPPPPIAISTESLFVPAPSPASPQPDPAAAVGSPPSIPAAASEPQLLSVPPVSEVDRGWDK